MSEEFKELATAVRDQTSLKLLYSGEMPGEELYERTDYDQDSVLVEDIRTLERHGIIENSDSGLPTVDVSRGNYSLTEKGEEMAEEWFERNELVGDELSGLPPVETSIVTGINSEGYNLSKSRRYKRGFVEQDGVIYEVRVDELEEGEVEVSNRPVQDAPAATAIERTTEVLEGELPETDQELRELSTRALEQPKTSI